MSKENKNKTVGFSSQKEEVFLGRLKSDFKEKSLKQELKTQLAEDFGLVEFTLKYKFDEDKNIVDLNSGEKLIEVMVRGGVEEETESVRMIENGLKNNPEQTWIHFSPKNEKLGYSTNAVDFWRVVDDGIVWNRIVVKNNFEEMNKVRKILSDKEETKNEMELLRSPIAVVNLRLVDIFDYFRLNETKNEVDFNYIEKVVGRYLSEFKTDFGEELITNSDLISRLYSACHNALKNRGDDNEIIISRDNLDKYMYGIMIGVKIEQSFGCSATTTVGSFGEKIGYYISGNGEVKYGKIPDSFKECKKCGCWYEGEKCPFC